MISAGNGVCKHFDCSNRTDRGYCKTTVCINPNYSQIASETHTSNGYVNCDKPLKICPKCGGIAEWNSYFHTYICTRPNCSYWKSAPIEDAVCVVRCRECKHRITVGAREYCEKWNSSDMLSANNDFFCAYGERRT